MLSWLFTSPAYGGTYYTPPVLREPTERDRYVEARLHALEVACAGLWQLLKDKNGYTDQELMALMGQDAQRPPLAPTIGGPNDVCPKCGHKMLTHNHCKCLWCGAELQGTPFST